MKVTVRPALSLSFCLTFAWLYATICTGQELPTRETVIQSLQTWRSSFANIHIVYEQRNPAELVAYQPDLAKEYDDLSGFYYRMEWIWGDHGVVRNEIHEYKAGVLVSVEVEGANGQTRESFRAVYKCPTVDSRVLESLTVRTMRSSAPTSVALPVPLMGIWHAGLAQWLPEILQRGEEWFENAEKSESGFFVHVKPDSAALLTLDSEKCFLPVRSDPNSGLDGMVFVVKSFEKIDCDIWFPKSGTLWLNYAPKDQIVSWVIVSAKSNQSLDRALFIPPKPEPNTHVTDRTPSRKYRPKDLGPNDLAKIAQESVPSGESVTAKLPSRWRWSVGLLIVAVVLLAGVFLAARRQ